MALLSVAATGLTSLERQVLELFAHHALRPHQIAGELEIPPSSVRSILHHACGFDPARAIRILDGLPEPEQEPEPEPELVDVEPEPEPEPEPETPSVGWAEMIEIGLTYRQLDYWTRSGYLHTTGAQTPGSGRLRRWPVDEVGIASLLLRLINAGLEFRVALHVARGGPHELAPGIRLVIDDEEQP